MSSAEAKLEALQRAYNTLQIENRILTEQFQFLKTSVIQNELRAAAKLEGIKESAIEDAVLHARDFTMDDAGTARHKDGLEPRAWLRSMKSSRPHWFGPAQKTAESIPNPWTREHWNITAQGQVFAKFGEAKAAEMAKAAGVNVFATRPAA